MLVGFVFWQSAAVSKSLQFSSKKVRSLVLALIVFVAETVPSFGPVLDFFGGSSVALSSVVFPCLFYLFLAAGERKAKEKEHLGSEEPLSFSG